VIGGGLLGCSVVLIGATVRPYLQSALRRSLPRPRRFAWPAVDHWPSCTTCDNAPVHHRGRHTDESNVPALDRIPRR
jgi:hypothetical protein